MKLGIVGVNSASCMVLDQLMSTKIESIAFYFDDDINKINKSYNGIKVLGRLDEVNSYYNKLFIDNVIICFGDKHLLKKKNLLKDYLKYGLSIPNFIDKSAIVKNSVEIKKGNIIGPNVIINSNSYVDSGVLIWSGTIIEHDNKVGNSAYFGPGVVTSGFVQIGECTMIGSGAVILPEITIGNNCVIGAGSVVTKNIPDNSVAYGNPCRIVRKNNQAERKKNDQKKL